MKAKDEIVRYAVLVPLPKLKPGYVFNFQGLVAGSLEVLQ